jgi:hypothetical protein
LSLSDLLRCEAKATTQGKSHSREYSVIILCMRGGPSQHATWDQKPDAPRQALALSADQQIQQFPSFFIVTDELMLDVPSFRRPATVTSITNTELPSEAEAVRSSMFR